MLKFLSEKEKNITVSIKFTADELHILSFIILPLLENPTLLNDAALSNIKSVGDKVSVAILDIIDAIKENKDNKITVESSNKLSTSKKGSN